MKRLLAALTASLMVLALAGSAFAAAPTTAPGQNKLLCFSGTTDGAAGGGFGGMCVLGPKGAKTNSTAILNNADTNPLGDYAGVYFQNSPLSGQLLSNVTKLGYTYSGTTIPGPGDLSLNVPINLTGGTTTDGFAFIDAAYCPGVAGVVDVIGQTTCGFYWQGVTFYPNMAAFVTANPSAKVATDNLTFVIAERTPAESSAIWTVSKTILGK
jgi:hypothetical protein